MTRPGFLTTATMAIVVVGTATMIGLWLLDAPHLAFRMLLTAIASIALLKTLPEESP
jgi:predicted PurR-regulated permease PerM